MTPFLDEMFSCATARSRSRYWLISDLQQYDPDLAERYFKIAMGDLKRIGPALDGVCYLGDAAEGVELGKLNTMIEMQTEQLDSLGVPIYYVMGNHELDYYQFGVKSNMDPIIPFYEAVKNRSNWNVIPDQEAFWFAHETPEFTMLFFSDHAAKDGSWCATHQSLPAQPAPADQETAAGGGNTRAPYPHTREIWQAVRDQFANTGKPVFTFSHYAFPGGNRESQFLEQLLPLPANYRAHFHGHAHIGDGAWAGKNLYRQVAAVDDHAVVQFDISSLDHLRGTTVRSAFFDYYGHGEYGVFFRDHLNARWEHAFISAHDAKEAGIPERGK